MLRRHLTDDQRAVMAAWWMKEHSEQGKRTDLTSSLRGAEVPDHPTKTKAQQLFNSTRAKLDKANYVQVRAPELARTGSPN